jgi:hypothetical protein
MKCGYARVSTDGQSIAAQVIQLTKTGCKTVFRETANFPLIMMFLFDGADAYCVASHDVLNNVTLRFVPNGRDRP